MTHCRVNDNWTNEDPKAVGKHFAKGGKQQQKTCPLKVFNKMPIKKQEKIFSHKNKNLQNLTSVDLHYQKKKKKKKKLENMQILNHTTFQDLNSCMSQ